MLTTGYSVHTNSVMVGGVPMQIRSLLDRSQFYDPNNEAGRAGISSATWPLFGLVWPSACVLADEMLRADIADKRVLELGCGLALASLVVQRRFGDITASDYHPLAGEFLAENLKLNGLAALAYARGDWLQHHPELGLFDLLIGSDVLYERVHPAMLAQFIDWHAKPSATVIVVDPDRGNRSGFTKALALLGFSCKTRRITALPTSGLPYKGRVLEYTR
jgi:SAM-dependent methyltransferase